MQTLNTINVGGVDREIEDTVARSGAGSILGNKVATLETKVNEIITPTGGAPNPDEIIDARIGTSNEIYTSLGDAIRTQINNTGYNLSKGLEDYSVCKTKKNIFNSNAVRWGSGFVDYSSGMATTNRNYASYCIPVKEGHTITINKTGGHISFYKSYIPVSALQNGVKLPNYISGTLDNENIAIPSKAVMMIVSYPKTDFPSMQIEYASSSTVHEPYRKYIDPSLINDRSISPDKITANVVTLQRGINLLNMDTKNKKNDVYCDPTQGGQLVSVSNYRSYAVAVEDGHNVSVNLQEGFVVFFSEYSDITTLNVGERVPFFISGSAYSNYSATNIPVPDGAKMLVVSTWARQERTLQVEYGSSSTTYHPYREGIPKELILDYDVIYNLNAYGSGDYTNLRECIANLGSYKHAAILLQPGEYDIRSYYTSAEWNAEGFRGLFIPPNVSIIGTGASKEDVVIKCVSEADSNIISTLNLQYNIELKNLTVYGENVRYTIHDDFSDNLIANRYGVYTKIENVDFIGKQIRYNYVYGEGTYGGARKEFKNCRFINLDKGHAYSGHDMYETGLTSTLAETHYFENCEFIGLEHAETVRLCPATSGVDQIYIFNGCIIPAIKITSALTGGEDSTAIYNIVGSGNSEDIQVSYGVNRDRLFVPRFGDVVKAGINMSGSAIASGSYVKKGNSGIIVGTASDNIGVAIKASAAGNVVYYQ